MPFSAETKNPGDLIKSQDWNDAMNAIVALFDKLDPATGHQHSGGSEDAPPIPEGGLANNVISTGKIQNGAVTGEKLSNNAVSSQQIASNAVTGDKIANNSVTTNKIGNNAVTGGKIANNTVGALQLAPNSVSANEIANNSVTTDKIVNGAVTLAKIASGIIPKDVGISIIHGIGNDTQIPIPTGFDRSECMYYAALKQINGDSATMVINDDGVLSMTEGNSAMAFAIAKKGGWPPEDYQPVDLGS